MKKMDASIIPKFIFPNSISIKKTTRILEQLKNSIFLIKCGEDKYGTGFFCKIPDIDGNSGKIRTLITSNKIINEAYFSNNKTIKIFLDENLKMIEINLKIKRKNYFPENISIIEIIKDDGIADENFLELEDNLLRLDSETFNKDESIYTLHYKEEDKASVSYGFIDEIDDNEISFYSDLDICSIGCPILNLSSTKVIGLYERTPVAQIIRKGINLKNAINNIKNMDKKREKVNEISIIIKPEEEGEKINFLSERSSYNDELIEQMNFNNIIGSISEIYIDDEKQEKIDVSFIAKELKLYNIRIIFEKAIDNCSNMFYGCKRIRSVNLSSFDSSEVINMMHMFHGCENLRYINFSNINTKKVKNMSGMFFSCRKLFKLDLSNFDTKNVRHMDHMFCNALNLENITFSKDFDTKNVINMENMFFNCYSLKKINLSTFKTNNVINMSNMFYACRNLKELDLSGFNTENVTNMDLMFCYCEELETLDLSKFNTKNVKSMSWMFYSCLNLTKLNLKGFNTENVRDLEEMFSSCKKLKELDLSSFNTKNVIYMDFMFDLCESLEKITLSDSPNSLNTFYTDNVINMRGMFFGCRSLKSIDLSSFDTSKVINMKWMFYNCKRLESLNFSENFVTDKVNDMERIFFECKNIKSLDLTNFDTKNVRVMKQMFSGCEDLEKIVFSKAFDTHNVIDMEGMFSGCKKLKDLDISFFSTENVIHMDDMFSRCHCLQSLDFKNFTTNNLISMKFMLSDCISLKEIMLNFDTSNVYNMKGLFSGCQNLTEIKFGELFTLKSVIDMEMMFSDCIRLKTLELPQNANEVKNAGFLFQNCFELTEIIMPNFDMKKLISEKGMFDKCEKLKTLIWDRSNVISYTAL